MYADFSPFKNIELTDADFKKISTLIYKLCGINLQEGKKELVRARLGKRIREGRFPSFRDYYQYVIQDPSGHELVHFLDSISTNFTSFFREQPHFDYLRTEILPEWMTAKKGLNSRMRIWSAGCSSGEEPYSIAITLLEALENPAAWNIQILASDLSSKVLRVAQGGVYEKERIATLPVNLKKKYFLHGESGWQNYVRVKDSLKQYIEFKRLNLMEPFLFNEPFDCIFCRNVMIYFDKSTQTDLVNRFHNHLVEGGVLFIGHSESLAGILHRFQYVKPAVYRK